MDEDGSPKELPTSSPEDGELENELIVDESTEDSRVESPDFRHHEDVTMAEDSQDCQPPVMKDFFQPPPGQTELTSEERFKRDMDFWGYLLVPNHAASLRRFIGSSDSFTGALLASAIESNSSVNAEKVTALEVRHNVSNNFSELSFCSKINEWEQIKKFA